MEAVSYSEKFEYKLKLF